MKAVPDNSRQCSVAPGFLQHQLRQCGARLRQQQPDQHATRFRAAVPPSAENRPACKRPARPVSSPGDAATGLKQGRQFVVHAAKQGPQSGRFTSADRTQEQFREPAGDAAFWQRGHSILADPISIRDDRTEGVFGSRWQHGRVGQDMVLEQGRGIKCSGNVPRGPALAEPGWRGDVLGEMLGQGFNYTDAGLDAEDSLAFPSSSDDWGAGRGSRYTQFRTAGMHYHRMAGEPSAHQEAGYDAREFQEFQDDWDEMQFSGGEQGAETPRAHKGQWQLTDTAIMDWDRQRTPVSRHQSGSWRGAMQPQHGWLEGSMAPKLSANDADLELPCSEPVHGNGSWQRLVLPAARERWDQPRHAVHETHAHLHQVICL